MAGGNEHYENCLSKLRNNECYWRAKFCFGKGGQSLSKTLIEPCGANARRFLRGSARSERGPR